MTQGRSTIGIEFEAMGGKTCQTQKTECKKEPCIRRTPVEEEDQQPAPTQSKRKVQKMKKFSRARCQGDLVANWCHDVWSTLD